MMTQPYSELNVTPIFNVTEVKDEGSHSILLDGDEWFNYKIYSGWSWRYCKFGELRHKDNKEFLELFLFLKALEHVDGSSKCLDLGEVFTMLDTSEGEYEDAPYGEEVIYLSSLEESEGYLKLEYSSSLEIKNRKIYDGVSFYFEGDYVGNLPEGLLGSFERFIVSIVDGVVYFDTGKGIVKITKSKLSGILKVLVEELLPFSSIKVSLDSRLR